MSIHSEHPFATPEAERSPLRRLRGRLPAAVTVWTAAHEGRRAGLTIASTLVVDGEPGRLVGVVDPDADLWEVAEASGRFAVVPLVAGQQQLADQFAGLAPAPGGLFRDRAAWQDTDWGPVPATATTYAGCRVDSSHEIGWGLLVEATVEHLDIGDPTSPLLYHRARYRTLD